MGANDVGEQLEAAIDDVIRLEAELERARRIAVRFEQELAETSALLDAKALAWFERGIALNVLGRLVSSQGDRLLTAQDYVAKTLSNIEDDASTGPWRTDEVQECLTDVVKLLEGKTL